MKRIVAGLAGCAVLLAGCTSGDHGPPSRSSAPKPLRSTHRASPPRPPGPAPTTTAEAACPLLAEPTAAQDIGVRIGRVTVQSSAGRPVGCRFYADQNPAYRASEHLPGPNQPVLQVVSSRYRDATSAHNAMVRLARAGANAYTAELDAGIEGISFQTRFDPGDGKTDWAYTFRKKQTVVVITTIQRDTAFDARAVAADIAARF